MDINKEVERKMKKYDRNGNNALEKNEFKSMIKDIYGLNYDESKFE